MKEPEFSELFNKLLSQLNNNIKNINGIDYYQIPCCTLNKLKKFFYDDSIEEKENLADDEYLSDEQYLSIF